MKRILFVASLLIVAIGAAACTREKPPVTEPTPAGIFAPGITPLATGQSGDIASPTPPATATLVLGTSVANDTPGAPIAISTLPPLSSTTTSSVAATVTPSSGGPTTYTVQWGDWLNKIAQRFGVTPQAILAANPGLDPNRIVPGQVINIPASGSPPTSSTPSGSTPGTYTVQRGDWFYSIARKFGVTVSALQAANPTVNPSAIYPGQVLYIPSGAVSPDVQPTPSTSGTTYTVQPGDTLFSIAVRFGKTAYDLQIANRLANPSAIFVGQKLIIP